MARGPNSEVKVRIAKMGGVHAAMNAVEQFPLNESLLRAAFHCLQQLGYNPSSYAAGQFPQQMQFHSPQQQQRQNFHQLDKVISGSPKQQNQMNQNEMKKMNMDQAQQSHLQRQINQNDMRQRNEVQQMKEAQKMRQMQMQMNQSQFQRLMSQNPEMQQVHMNQSQQQQMLLNRQRQQMLAMAQGGGLPNEEMMMRLNMMNNMSNTGSSQSILGLNNDVQGEQHEGNNSMSGNNDNNRRNK
jgi:hypothetical protein